MSQILAITLPLPVLLALVALLLVGLAMVAVALVLGQPAQVRPSLHESLHEALHASGGAAAPPVPVKPER